MPFDNSVHASLHERIHPETGEVYWLVDHVCEKVHKFVAPRGFYQKSKASNAVGMFSEWYMAYLLQGNKTYNSRESTPDVQLRHPDDLSKTLLFEVKAGHANNAILLKRNQLERFTNIPNCLYAFIFHRIPRIQALWNAWMRSRRRVRKALEHEYSSIFILPPHILLAYYAENTHREHDMPHYKKSNEKFIRMSEAQTRKLFNQHADNLPSAKHDRIHLISPDLSLDPKQTYPSSIIRI